MMQTYILRVYRAHPGNVSVSGMVEDIESGQKKYFNSFNDLITVLAKSMGKGQLELSELAPREQTPVALAG